MSIGRWPADEPLPVVLTDRDLMRVLGVSPRTFYQRKSEGTYDGLICYPPLTKTTRYSSVLVRKWIDGVQSRLRRAS